MTKLLGNITVLTPRAAPIPLRERTLERNLERNLGRNLERNLGRNLGCP